MEGDTIVNRKYVILYFLIQHRLIVFVSGSYKDIFEPAGLRR